MNSDSRDPISPIVEGLQLRIWRLTLPPLEPYARSNSAVRKARSRDWRALRRGSQALV